MSTPSYGWPGAIQPSGGWPGAIQPEDAGGTTYDETGLASGGRLGGGGIKYGGRLNYRENAHIEIVAPVVCADTGRVEF